MRYLLSLLLFAPTCACASLAPSVAREAPPSPERASTVESGDVPTERVAWNAPLDVAPMIAADTTSGPVNSLPKPSISGQNGLGFKELSIDAQVGQAVTGSTGATAATTSFTVMKADTTFTALRGKIVGNTTNGYFVLQRSGLYRLEAQCNGSAANGETSTIEIAYTTDDTNYTTVSGATASFVALTGALTQGMHAVGYLDVSTSQASAGTLHVVVRGKNSAGTLTCKSMSLLTVSRVDAAQPLAYP